MLPEHVVGSLQNIGLDLKTIGDTQTTIEEVQRLLYSLGQHEIASSLRQRLDLGKTNCQHSKSEIVQLCH